MVRRDKESRWLWKGLVLREHPRIHMAVGADQWEGPRLFVEGSGDPTDRGIGVEETVFVENQGLISPRRR